MRKRNHPCFDPEQAEVLCYCRRCAREIYFTADGVRLGAHMLCADCVRQLRREVNGWH